MLATMEPPEVRRLTPAEEDAIIKAYRAWDPAEESQIELAQRLGISKATLHAVRNRRNEPRKVRAKRSELSVAREFLDQASELAYLEALGDLAKDNSRLRRRIADLEAQLKEMED